MTQFTRLGYLGTPGGYNDADFTLSVVAPTTGQWTRLGYFGTAGGWNPGPFAIEDTVTTVSVTFDAAFIGTFEPFDEWRIRAHMPAELDAATNEDFAKSNTEIDLVVPELRSTYAHEVEWI